MIPTFNSTHSVSWMVCPPSIGLVLAYFAMRIDVYIISTSSITSTIYLCNQPWVTGQL